MMRRLYTGLLFLLFNAAFVINIVHWQGWKNSVAIVFCGLVALVCLREMVRP